MWPKHQGITKDANTGGISTDSTSRFAGLVNFGPPFDKIAFFFKNRRKAENYVQLQILAHFHKYRHVKLPCEEEFLRVDGCINNIPDNSKWFNFYHQDDLVNGHLDIYRLDDGKNSECKEVVNIVKAHDRYWNCSEMYKSIVEECF
jgi:hypothetical protein